MDQKVHHPTVLKFSEIYPENLAHAGGKGGTLARLFQAGLPVPDGFILFPEAFADDRLKQTAWHAAQVHLERLHRKHPHGAFAVRSSAMAEDSARASFAGEFETRLEVRTHEEIYAAIESVRRSRHSDRVQAYSRARGQDPAHELAVIVQCLVPAEFSGVLFTADPLTGSRNNFVGNFIQGLGERLVSGTADAESFNLTRPAGLYRGPEALKPYRRQLYRLGIRLEKTLGAPQDVEWAARGGRIYLLQSRPITTLIAHDPPTGAWNDSLTGDFLWSDVNLGEAMPDVMTPFTWSILQRGALKDWISFQGFPTFGNIGGRAYFNISILASVLSLMGRGKDQILTEIEGVLHLKLPTETEIPLLPAPRHAIFSTLRQLITASWVQRRDLRALPPLLEVNKKWCDQVRGRLASIESPDNLAEIWTETIYPQLKRLWSCFLSSTNHYVSHTTALRGTLQSLVGPEDADALISGLSSETELLASLGPLIGLAQVRRSELSRETYLARFGHRSAHEFEFSIPRPAEDPDWLDRQLADFDAASVDIETLLLDQQGAFQQAWGRLRSSHPRKAKRIRRKIDQIAPRARLRESTRSEFGHLLWVVRDWALRAGEFTGLDETIFFLPVDEILKVLHGDFRPVAAIPPRKKTYEKYSALPPYPHLIRGRFDPEPWAEDPHRRTDLFDASKEPNEAADPVSADHIRGAAGSAGRVEGRVRVLTSLAEADQLQPGEILVTAQTNIGWTLIFPRAAAIVTDVGAPLSHAAIVARELGIPAVVGCGDATLRLQTGDWVKVDGGRGFVFL